MIKNIWPDKKKLLAFSSSTCHSALKMKKKISAIRNECMITSKAKINVLKKIERSSPEGSGFSKLQVFFSDFSPM